jgi:hypothetical protein
MERLLHFSAPGRKDKTGRALQIQKISITRYKPDPVMLNVNPNSVKNGDCFKREFILIPPIQTGNNYDRIRPLSEINITGNDQMIETINSIILDFQETGLNKTL